MTDLTPEDAMFRLMGKLLKLSVCLPLLGLGVYTASKIAVDHHIQIPFGFGRIFEGSNILRVTVIRRDGERYDCASYRITENNRLHVEDQQGLDINGLRASGEPKEIDLDPKVVATLHDLSLLVTAIKPGQQGDHLMEVQRRGDPPFQVAPDRDAASSVLLRSIQRFSSAN